MPFPALKGERTSVHCDHRSDADRLASFPNHDICECIAGLENRLLAKMNQRPKLGSEGRGVNVGFWVTASW
jgi:hypothetical protein